LTSLLIAFAVCLPTTAQNQTFNEPGFVAETVFTVPAFRPVGMTWASDDRMFIQQKDGVVRVYFHGSLHPTPFIDLRGSVNTFEDRGLLGLAVDRNFAENGYVYLAYTPEPTTNPKRGGTVRRQGDLAPRFHQRR